MKEFYPELVEAEMTVDYLFAYADLDDFGNPKNDAITVGGYPADGMARIVNLKDRAKGNRDAEIVLDGVEWDKLSEPEQRALLDHELYHFTLGKGTDDLSRPKLRMRKHDVHVGWFGLIAERHGIHSAERRQAKQIMEVKGQIYWPELVNAATEQGRFQKIETKG